MSSALDREWAAFVRDGVLPSVHKAVAVKHVPPADADSRMPLESDQALPPLTISTRSNNALLNSKEDIDVWAMFWALPVMPYTTATEGVIKKQIKVQCTNREELVSLKARVKRIRSHVFSKVEHIDDPDGTTPFRYVSKLSIGLASKEVKAHRAQEKNAFFNSFTMVLRVRYKGSFKEIVTKVFNRNVLSLPGMLDAELRNGTLSLIDRVLGDTSIMLDPEKPPLMHLPGTITGVMVNSNFWCGFGLDRDKIVNLMRGKYELETSYDPSNYPGVICRYYQPVSGDTCGRCTCNPPCSTLRIGDKKSAGARTKAAAVATSDLMDPGVEGPEDAAPSKCQKLTFMLFRTGSVLIVGRCEQDLLDHVHKFVAGLLALHRHELESGTGERPNKKNVRKKSRKRIAWIEPQTTP